MSFPKDSELKPKNMLDVRDPVSRVSLDTFYQVTFSFGKQSNWFKGTASGGKKFDGLDFKQKMNLLCTQAEIPGTSYLTTQAVGHHQGVQEIFPTLRQFPPLNLTFYVDADHLILEVIESWMSYINPLSTNSADPRTFGRLSYPETYKETVHVSKFERDTFLEGKNTAGDSISTTSASHYEFVNVWPQNMQSIRISYGQSSIMRCSIALSYDRFFTDFTSFQSSIPVASGDLVNNSKDIKNSIADDRAVEGGYTISKQNLNTTGQLVRADNAQYGNTFPAGSF